MTGFVVFNEARHSYLERKPFDGSYSWIAYTADHATVFSYGAAVTLAIHYQRECPNDGVRVDFDPIRSGRAIEIDLDDVESYIVAEEQEPPIRTFEEALATKCDQIEREREALQVKRGQR